jgi:hypothetical protein
MKQSDAVTLILLAVLGFITALVFGRAILR